MSTLWKVLVGLLLTLPIASYVAGTLVASQAELPGRRTPIVISDSATGTQAPRAAASRGGNADPGGAQGTTPAPQSPTADDHRGSDDRGGDRADGRGDDRGDDHGDDRGDDHGDDDEIEVVRPTPEDIDDDDEDDDHGGDEAGDDHGHDQSDDDHGGDD